MTEKDNRRVPLIDTHCHLDMSEFDNDREEVIARAKDTGFEALISVGSDFVSTAKAMELATLYDFIYAAVGVHPHDAKDFSDEMYLGLASRALNRKVVAIGETGLDYHYDHSPRDAQREVFRKHLRLAKEAGLPVIVHSREAKEDTMAILAESGIDRGVLHCFSGDLDMAEQAMSMGLFISLAGPVTFKKSSRLREIARLIPDEYLLIETDAPYLSPEPFRGRRNEPSYLEHTAKFIADLREISLDDLARITTLNAKRLFGIGTLPDRAEIAYQIRDSLYLNITNRCTNACSFCVKFRSDFVKGHRLRLSHEPTEEEITRSIGDPSLYNEVVFCGYGEPLQRLDTVKHVARWIKERGGRVRINTNGHANLIHKRDILPELKGIVDSISVSLDAQDEATYNRLCKPAFKNAHAEIIWFIRQAKEFIPDVQATVVELEGVDIEKCREIAAQLGVKLRIRKLDVVG
ncbi:MAG: YchF/TatD family DNA exonuclease [Nitrospiraceae bacterium]|nr:YchF/TatD family DNA exonuclease [Nitrospiraceae bacterium]